VFQIPNEQCEPILNMYVPRDFNDIKNATNHWVVTPVITPWIFGSPLGLHLPKWELPWENEGSLPHTPSHFLHSRECDVTLGLFLALISELLLALTPGLPLGSQPCNPFALVRSPKLGLRQSTCQILSSPPKPVISFVTKPGRVYEISLKFQASNTIPTHFYSFKSIIII